MGRRDAQVRGGSHLREPPGFPGHVRATRPRRSYKMPSNSVKAFLGIAVQAMNDKADQVGRSTMWNEGMINVQIARIDDALTRLARLESASTSTFCSSELERWYNNSQGQHRLQESVEECGELRDEEWTCLPRFGQRREDGDRAGGRAHGPCHRVD